MSEEKKYEELGNGLIRIPVKAGNIEIGNYIIFKGDEGCLEEIIKNFAYSKDGLVPQPWFGNITEPKIIILGINPGFKSSGKINDMTDNLDNSECENSIRAKLIDNLICDLKENDGIDSIKWILEKGNNCWLSSWWCNRFFGKENIEIIKKEEYINDIGIFNLYGYYSYNSDWIKSKNNKIKSHLNPIEFKKIVKKANVIIFLWEGAIRLYEKKLALGENYFKNLKNKVYIGNKSVTTKRSTGINTKFFKCYPYNDSAKEDKTETIEEFLKMAVGGTK